MLGYLVGLGLWIVISALALVVLRLQRRLGSYELVVVISVTWTGLVLWLALLGPSSVEAVLTTIASGLVFIVPFVVIVLARARRTPEDTD